VKIYISVCFLACIFNSSIAGTIEDKAKALDAIATHAERMCAKFQLHGESKRLSLDAGADAELLGLMRKLASVGVHVAGRYDSEKYDGYLQRNLVDAAAEKNRCAARYSDKLMAIFFPTEPVILKTEITPKYSITELLMPDGRICTTIVESGKGTQKCTQEPK
jgi:hypothetical protein